MDLIVVESPTKAKTLSKFLGSDFQVEATMGHIKDLPKSQLGVDVDNNFKPDYMPVAKKADIIRKLKKAVKKAKIIYLATDPDREGEAISLHVKELLDDKKAKEAKRIVFHEITKEAVEEALAHPKEVDQNLVDAQVARRVLDRLVGYKLSPLLWKKVRRGLSAGRVQSVAVRLVVEKEREIKAFKEKEFWEITCLLKPTKANKKEEFLVQLIKVGEAKSDPKKEAFLLTNEKDAQTVVSDLEKANYQVLEVKKREVIKSPYPPFTTSTMTQAAARLFGWSAKKTMTMAQRLYEEGLITYHRTDSLNIAKAAIEKVRGYISKEYGKIYLPDTPRYYKTSSKSAQEAHEAIRPTNPTDKGLAIDDPAIKKLYDLIWKKFVSCQMTPARFDETTIEVAAKGGKQEYLLRTSGQIMRFDGWRRVSPTKMEEDIQELPDVTKDEKLDLIKVNSEQRFTQPPARFNEASLIKILEKMGIGRPSTYAPIITTIQIRNYVEKEEGKFFPTPIGDTVTDFLVKYFPTVLDYDFTAQMEGNLDKVADGKTDWVKDIKDFYTPFAKILIDTEKNADRVKIETEKLNKPCPECGKTEKGELVVRTGRFGKFISCSRFPDCKYTEKIIQKINMKCPDCKDGEVILRKTKKGRKFYGCSRYPDCNFASWKKPGSEKEKD